MHLPCSYFGLFLNAQNIHEIDNLFMTTTKIKLSDAEMPAIRYCDSFNVFKESIRQFIRPSMNSTYKCISSIWLKNLIRLIPHGLSHLPEFKFKHSFTFHPSLICIRGFVIESVCHYLLHWPNFTNERTALLDTLFNTNVEILRHNSTTVVKILLYSDPSLKELTNTLIF